MKFWTRNPAGIFGLVLLWRVLLLVFTAQPIPANDAYGYDGAVVNFLHGGGYCNPSLAVVFPISGREIYSMYPPFYQVVLLAWMKVFGTSAFSAMALHVAMFAVSGFLTLAVMKRFVPAATGVALAVLLFFGFTFDDRPDGLAYVFGMGSFWLVCRQISAERFHAGTAAGLALALSCVLYTSVIVGAYFFGAGFLACAVAFLSRRKIHWFIPFIAAAILFAVITLMVAKLEPRWWAGFQESARQQPVVGQGFHPPHGQAW